MFFNDTATTEIYTLSLHDALPIFEHRLKYIGQVTRQILHRSGGRQDRAVVGLTLRAQRYVLRWEPRPVDDVRNEDRKSTRLNSSHANISYAVFCLKKNKKTQNS